MAKSQSNRIIATPSSYAFRHYLYVQEAGSLQSIEPHISKRENLTSYLIFAVMKGSGRIFYRGRYHKLSAGDCIYINCQEEYAHESSLEDPWELSWVHFYGKDADSFYKSFSEQEYDFLMHPTDFSLFSETLALLYKTQADKHMHKELLCHRYLTDLIALCFLENSEKTRLTDHSIYEKVEQVRSFIDTHYAEHMTLDALASQFFISKFHLSREFKRITGNTIGNYILDKRIGQAKNLLRFSSQPLDEISRSCGFSDSGYFIKVFKKAENLTPNQYRKRW